MGQWWNSLDASIWVAGISLVSGALGVLGRPILDVWLKRGDKYKDDLKADVVWLRERYEELKADFDALAQRLIEKDRVIADKDVEIVHWRGQYYAELGLRTDAEHARDMATLRYQHLIKRLQESDLSSVLEIFPELEDV